MKSQPLTVAPQKQRKKALPDVLNRQQCYPVYDLLCDLLPVTDIISLTRTCKGFSTLCKDLLASKWNIDRVLSRFVTDTKGFRSQMAQYDALIAGYLALDFFTRRTSKDLGMHVFVGKEPGGQALEKYLQKEEGTP
jgi:hypothetical protein